MKRGARLRGLLRFFNLGRDFGFIELCDGVEHVVVYISQIVAGGELRVSDVLTPSCGARRSREDASPVDEMGSHTWLTI